MFHNQAYGDETITKEYKEFTFNHIGLEFDSSVADTLVKTSRWVFNSMIENSIEKYLKIYVPKYASAFMDSFSETQFGELYIGIDDYGNVQGIPYQGEIHPSFISNKIKMMIEKYIISSEKEHLAKNIRVEVIKVDYDKTSVNDYPEMYQRYVDMTNEQAEKEKEYQDKLKAWSDEFYSFTQRKLVDLFNLQPSRSKLYEYIKSKNPTSSVLQMIEDGFQLEQKTHEEISECKEDQDNPYFWVCEWKDKMVDDIKPLKPFPKHRNDFCTFLQPINILTKVTPMIPWWINKNDNINLYVIKITFLKTRDDIEVYYLDSFDKVNRCYRTTEFGRPCCTPV